MIKRMIAIALLAIVLLGGAVAWSFLRPPEEASGPIQATPVAASTTTTGGATGAQTVFAIDQSASQARFLLDETLNGAPFTVVGTTNQVAGQIAVDPAAPATARVGTIQVNARSLATDSANRDRAIQNQVLKTGQNEFITFVPTSLVGLPATGSVGQTYTFQIVGQLTISGVTREATFEATVTQAAADRLQGKATTTIRHADYNLSIPQVPFVANVADTVRLEIEFAAKPA
jgi:polyisoprenoid-binding protein YceI